MYRFHRMPFGAQLQEDGAVRFRLWAPSAKSVELCLDEDEKEKIIAMRAEAEGWYALTTDAVRAGSRYRFRIDGGQRVPDPASRCQPDDVHEASEVIDPRTYAWGDAAWRGRPWEETVLYELHVGSFTRGGDFAGVAEKLDHLIDLGVTAIELMPVADFPGTRNWGYDGVYTFAPDARYGRPEALKALIDQAHAKGLMVFLDVVYNHFGPDGNYLHLYAGSFFTERHHTPWGAAINFDGKGSRAVRDFFIHNALYWLTEYHFDGLRFDAVHAIKDDSTPDILIELAETVRARIPAERHVHLVLENDDNAARYLARDEEGRPRHYVAQWNDDVHHALHVVATGESGGYYADYADRPLAHLMRCLTEGFAYQGEPSSFRGGAARGEQSWSLPYSAFVSFLQNHDQIGNRAFGERIVELAPAEAVRALTAVFLLAPAPPLLFMGEEWGAREPFLFFCDFHGDLARAVTEGRRREFARFPQFSDEKARERIPDPNAVDTYDAVRLDWRALEGPEGREWLALHRDLLHLRAREIVPRLAGITSPQAGSVAAQEGVVNGEWGLAGPATLYLLANLGESPRPLQAWPSGRCIFPGEAPARESAGRGELGAWSVMWFLAENDVINL